MRLWMMITFSFHLLEIGQKNQKKLNKFNKAQRHKHLIFTTQEKHTVHWELRIMNYDVNEYSVEVSETSPMVKNQTEMNCDNVFIYVLSFVWVVFGFILAGSVFLYFWFAFIHFMAGGLFYGDRKIWSGEWFRDYYVKMNSDWVKGRISYYDCWF